MRYAALITAICILTSCSLDYGKSVNVEDSIPEFRFSEARYSQYEDNKQTLELAAERIEQYKSDGSSYARKASFKRYDEKGQVETEGSCDLLSADTKNELYLLFDNIYMHLHSQDLKIKAKSLRFDAKTEQITCGADDEVSIEKKDTLISGKGFSASGVSKTFSFADTISGKVTTQEENSGKEAAE
ncbi:MAG: LPS export ABC transporter periplasmic protein LptC [Treponema sp.]|nr:LPS export ABC transporter periplasmic protein LptC [Treponema sp.]MBR4463674.1 LPS export ABC transporter periplasmic protein LptC [Treponema sp.]